MSRPRELTRQERLNRARMMHDGWLKAETAVMSGQEYYMAGMRLRRADLDMIARRIVYWANEEMRLQNGSESRMRVQRAVPRDV